MTTNEFTPDQSNDPSKRSQTATRRQFVGLSLGGAGLLSSVDLVRENRVGATINVTVLETDSPVHAGEYLEVTAELYNPSTTTVTREVRLVVGKHNPTVDAVEEVTLASGESRLLTLGFGTATVENNQAFPVVVETDDHADAAIVLVYGTDATERGAIAVNVLETDSPVDAGEYLEVTAELYNPGEEAVSREVRLVVGEHDPTVDAVEEVTLAPGESRRITLGFGTATVENDQEFPVVVETDDYADEATVLVYGTDGGGGSGSSSDGGPSAIRVDILNTDSPVDAGEYLEVTAELHNPGDEVVTEAVKLVVGEHNPTVDAVEEVTLAPGESRTIALGFGTATVENDQTFPVVVESESDSDTESVTVYGTG